MTSRTSVLVLAAPWVLLILGCGSRGPAAEQPATPTDSAARAPTEPAPSPTPNAPQSEREGLTALEPTPRAACSPADWAARSLPPLLAPGKAATPSRPDRQGAAELAPIPGCTDAPGPLSGGSSAAASVVIDGVEIRLASATPAGSSGRGWSGNQCAFELRLADGSGAPVRLGPEQVPPFNTISALVRSASAAWLSVSFNGYTREFPQGGNRIIALDLCAGRVVWQSQDSTSNGGLLLLDDYLVAPYGFTSERRYVFVLDARSGNVIQKLPIIENICPSKSWAPNHRPGQRCDAPGQAVGAATSPRVEGGVFVVDTNTGSAAFQFR